MNPYQWAYKISWAWMLCGLSPLCLVQAQQQVEIIQQPNAPRIPQVQLVANQDGDGFFFSTPLRLTGSSSSSNLKILGWRAGAFFNAWDRPIYQGFHQDSILEGCRLVGDARYLQRSQDGRLLAINYFPRIESDTSSCAEERDNFSRRLEILSADGLYYQSAFVPDQLSPNFHFAAFAGGGPATVVRLDLASNQSEFVSFAEPSGAAVFSFSFAGVSDQGDIFAALNGRIVRRRKDGGIKVSEDFTDCAGNTFRGSFRIRNVGSSGNVQLLCIASDGATELWDGELLTRRIVSIGLERVEFASDDKTLLLFVPMAASGTAKGGATHLYGYDLATGALRPLLQGTGSVIAADISKRGELFALLASGEVIRRNRVGSGVTVDGPAYLPEPEPTEVLLPAGLSYTRSQVTLGTVWDPIPLALCCRRLGDGLPETDVPFPGVINPGWTADDPRVHFFDLFGQSYAVQLPLALSQRQFGTKRGVLRQAVRGPLELPLRHDVAAIAPAAITNPLRLEPSDTPITIGEAPLGARLGIFLRGLGGTIPPLDSQQNWPTSARPLQHPPSLLMRYICGEFANSEGLSLTPSRAQTEPGTQGLYRISLEIPKQFPGCAADAEVVLMFLTVDFSAAFAALPAEATHPSAKRSLEFFLGLRKN